MKVAIISDTHDNLVNLEKFLLWAERSKTKELIMCGDLCAPVTLAKCIAPKFKGRIHVVFGNVSDRSTEKEWAEKLENVSHYGDLGEFEIDGKKIAITHFPWEAKKLAESGKYDFVFYGHSHEPWIEKVGETYLANPGTLAGMFQKATFAVWDTKSGKLELKILETL